MRPLQVGQIGGLQVPVLPMQAGLIPAQTTSAIDINSIINMMMMMMMMVMMMKMMGSVTAGK